MFILAFTLHQIIRDKQKLPINAVVEIFEKDDPAALVRAGAIREPTAQEIALYEMAHPKPAVAKSEKPVAEPKQVAEQKPKGGKKADAPAVETAPAPVAADPAPVDPEVTESLV